MIVAATHHRQRGTHDAESVVAWLSDKPWLPVSVDAIKADLAANSEGLIFLPAPRDVWVLGNDRIAVSTVNKSIWNGPRKMEAAGWRLHALFCLEEVLDHFRSIGFKCSGCEHSFPDNPDAASWRSPWAQSPSIWEPGRIAICCSCASAADAAIRREPGGVERALQMPAAMKEARAAMRAIQAIPRKRLPAAVRSRLPAIALVIEGVS